ncbi:MAG: zf-HC2 domain-containing protein [Planctomycetes bacterium]|nr:zf-HC2 domain-containing protein [Planctomycetota bacterium]
MNCERAEELALMREDGEVAPAEAREFAEHVEACVACAEFAVVARRLEWALRASALPELAPDEVEFAARGVTRRIRRRVVLRRGGFAAALAAAVIACALLWSREDAPTKPDAVVEVLPQVAPRSAPPAELPRRDEPAPATDFGPPLAAEVDPELAGERERARATFADAAAPDFAMRADVESFALAVDASIGVERARTDAWLRQVEGLLRDGDALVAARAARYLGVRGDRRSVAPLVRSTARAALVDATAAALVDLAVNVPTALAAALNEPASRDLALDRAAANGLAGVAVVDALREVREVRAEQWATALARVGSNELGFVVALVARGSVPLDVLGDTLAARGFDGAELAKLASASRGGDADVWLELFARAPVADAVPWLVESLFDKRRREAAARALGALDDDAGLEEALDATVHGRARRADLATILRTRAEHAPEALARFARSLVERGTSYDSAGERTETLVEALIETESAACASALAPLACARSSPPESRLLALEALSEHGSEPAALALADAFGDFTRREKRLAAVALVAIRRHGGDAALDRALAGFADAERRPIRDLLSRRAFSSAVTVQLARLLEARLPDEADRRFDSRITP